MLIAALTLLAATALPVDLASIDRLVVAPDNQSFAWIGAPDSDPAVTIVVDRKGPRRTVTFSRDDVTKWTENAVVTDLEWSADGRFLAVEIRDSDVDGQVLLVDTLETRMKFQPVLVDGTTSLAIPHWGSGHRLWVVNGNGDAIGSDEAAGIFGYDVDTKKTSRLLDRFWINDFTIAGDVITAVAVDQSHADGGFNYRLVRYDLKTKKVDTLMTQHETDEQRPTSLSL